MISYAQGIFTREFSEGNKKYYATFHPEVIVDEEEYSVTKRWFIVLLHPDLGLTSFFIAKNGLLDSWEIANDTNTKIENEFLEWCGYQIEKSSLARIL